MSAKYDQAPKTEGKTIHWPLFYDILVGVLFWGREKAARERTLDLGELKPGESVLDVGCGTGALTLAAKARVGQTGKVYGIDAAPEMIERARRKAVEAGMDVDFQTAAVESLPFPDALLDVVLSSLMLHHLPGDLRRKALVEMCRVLRPGGRLMVVDFEPPRGKLGRALVLLVLGHTMADTDIRDFLPLIQSAGFSEIECGSTGVRLLSFARAKTSNAHA